MLTLKGIYQNGQIQLEQLVTSEKPIMVIVTFLEEATLSSPSWSKTNEVMSHFQASLEKNYRLGELLAK